MTDRVDKKTRSKMMSAVRSKDTKIETLIRKCLFARGFRYRLHSQSLPGKPDIVFPKYSAVTFIHGCFWHLHGCARSTVPDSRREWWLKKLQDNKIRDGKNLEKLQLNGWRVLIVWECSVRRTGMKRDEALATVCQRAAEFLQSDREFLEISGPLPNVVRKGRITV